jgi:hypothetical protein
LKKVIEKDIEILMGIEAPKTIQLLAIKECIKININ